MIRSGSSKVLRISAVQSPKGARLLMAAAQMTWACKVEEADTISQSSISPYSLIRNAIETLDRFQQGVACSADCATRFQWFQTCAPDNRHIH